MQEKKNFQNVKTDEKRSIDNSDVDDSRKRARNVRSHLRKQQLTTKSIKQLDSTVIGHSNNINNDSISTTGALQLQNAKKWTNSLSLRCGRNTKLLTRFR
jgi:hypothetical protein